MTVNTNSKLNWQSFKKMNIQQKWDEAKKLRLCYKCLMPGHMLSQCKKDKNCGVDGCQQPHHYMLHRPNLEQRPALPRPVDTKQLIRQSKGILQVCLVKIKGSNGSELEVQALLDTGATHSLVSKDIVDLLELNSIEKKVTVNTLHKMDEQSVNVVEVQLQAVDTKFADVISCYSNEIFNLGNDKVT